jgi:hypothetical protein
LRIEFLVKIVAKFLAIIRGDGVRIIHENKCQKLIYIVDGERLAETARDFNPLALHIGKPNFTKLLGDSVGFGEVSLDPVLDADFNFQNLSPLRPFNAFLC